MATNFTGRFFDRAVRPPKGGWTFPIPGGPVIERYSESDVLAEVRKLRKNNGTFTGDDDIQSELWQYWCSREPERCGGVKLAPEPRVYSAPIELTPEVYGPWVWRFMNFAAARWEPGTADQFLSFLDWIVVLIDCPICREEWRTIPATKPPSLIKSRLDACTWVNEVHNSVNRRTNKPIYPYERMVAEYGAPSL